MERGLFLKLLEEEHLALGVIKDGATVYIEPVYRLKGTGAPPRPAEYYGYVLRGGGYDGGKLLDIAGVAEIFTGDPECKSVGGFASYEDLKWYDKLLKIDLEELTAHYLPLADSFSLACPYNGGGDGNRPFGAYGITKKDADAALLRAEKEEKAGAYEWYAHMDEEDRAKLPAFDALFEDICADCRAYAAAHMDEVTKKLGATDFAEAWQQGKTKYKFKPDGAAGCIGAIHCSADFLYNCRYIIDVISSNSQMRPITCELEEAGNTELKPFYIKTELVFKLRQSGVALEKEHYFKFNGQSARWLNKFKKDYYIDGFTDLCFYKGGCCVYMSDTEKGYRDDIALNARRKKCRED